MNGHTYIQPDYIPDRDSDVITTLYIDSLVPLTDAADAIAAESSIGTWTKLHTMSEEIFESLGAKVFYLNEISKIVKIAYPLALFETDNIPQLLADIGGNIFGMKEIRKMQLVDVQLPDNFLKANPGPSFGINGIRDYVGVFDRPLIGTIIKPKVGLKPEQHASVAYKAWLGGVDLVKDDENLSDQSFCPFKERAERTMEKKNRIEDQTGEKKIYAANISARMDEMIERAEFVKKLGGHCIMVDVVTIGFAGLQDIRRLFPDMIIHGHRAMHGALTHLPDHGISMLVLSKLARLAGTDSLHTGTVIGKMEGERQEVTAIDDFLRSPWGPLETTLPVASGGLHPGHIPALIKILGNDLLANFGGGIHGHPDGTKSGALAVRQAMEAAMKNIPLYKYAKDRPELKKAIELWGIYGDEKYTKPITHISKYLNNH